MTVTRSVLPEATKTLVPDLLSSSADGCRPAGMKAGAFNRPLPAGENTARVLAPQSDTNTDPSGVTATAYGYRPAASRCTTAPVETSTTARESARFSATYNVRPSPERARPAG